MIAQATLTIDLAKIEENARRVVAAVPGVEVVAVTKVTCADERVARALLAGGASGLADSRLENIARLRQAGIAAPIWLLRAPTPALAEETVRLADVSLESEVATVEALDRAALRLGRRHKVVLMVDLGDLREGVMPGDLPALLERTEALDGLEVLGIGTSLTCYGAIVPTPENLGLLAGLVRAAETRIGRPLLVSGGMSSSLDLAAVGRLPAGITNLRVGESILLGVSTVTREPILGLHTDAIVVRAPVIECLRKPSNPVGVRAQDAFGGVPEFEDRGVRRRAICALGRQDAVPDGLRPIDPRVRVLGASSDHLILDVEDLPSPPAVGDAIAFVPNYAATLHLFTSPYVNREYLG